MSRKHLNAQDYRPPKVKRGDFTLKFCEQHWGLVIRSGLVVFRW